MSAPGRAPAPAGTAAPGRLRRLLGHLRMSRFEARITLALVIAASLPPLGAILLAGRLAEENLTLGLDPRVVDRLESIPSLYGDLFQARKALYAEQARALARGLPRDPAAGSAYLASALERTPRLRRVIWTGPDGQVVSEAETQAPNPEGEWREAPARVGLPGGGQLECVFAIEARYFAEVAESRELAELVQNVERLQAEIRRSYVRAFGLLLVAWAVVAAGVGFWLARRTTRRVSDLVRAVRRLAAGDLAVQVDPGRHVDEVAGLARAFNAMVREVRESRDRIVYLEKISGWQEVARRLAHEIKNPLTPMQLAFQQLEARWKATPGGDPAFGRLLADAGEIVREEIGTLQRLVEEFSGFAKLPQVRPEPSDLGEFVEEFVRTSPQIAEAADVDVVRASPSCPVGLDRALMRRVLANLCANAVEAARPGRARIHLGVARTRDRAVLTVADEGPGIERDLRERIFDPYFTTKGTGTGLGLAIVKKIVLQHGGEIQAGERPGGGASFTVALPLAAPGDSPGAARALRG
ncbi:histidine kinase [Anaeromyxobacter dehalogenans 2CP-1]|uniref:histidine kinase n=1 Tax=Anaeromyxobacter dehalogenans (strain ATCC BAA-258 / DSM 21875 / 2CP-1) TaxID=455488 RepID=B8JFV6_ANAD2|nr:HAMP domain-containing sensor histidine kinase [Anaeromyxobacter dehalogenans]ACL64544.1 histidine kinase [Anaeromyxobacter dehalogenans 2CP-1]